MKTEKYKKGFEKFLMFPFGGILNSFLLAIAAILIILLIAAMGRSFGATKVPANIPMPQSATRQGYYQAIAAGIYKKVYALDKAIQTNGKGIKLKVNSGYSPSKAHNSSKLDKKTQKNEKN
jgi:hypothetical protein